MTDTLFEELKAVAKRHGLKLAVMTYTGRFEPSGPGPRIYLVDEDLKNARDNARATVVAGLTMIQVGSLLDPELNLDRTTTIVNGVTLDKQCVKCGEPRQEGDQGVIQNGYWVCRKCVEKAMAEEEPSNG